MKKRILSILLCLVMVMGLLPMQAVAEEGQECANCSHIHWGDAVCESCGECFENGADRCPIHEDEPHCAECAGFVCEECQRCEYVDDISECSVCGDPVDKAPHNRTAAGRCEICGYDPENPVFFAVQPRSITKKVSYDDAEETDPNSPYVNRGKFSATAVNLAGEELSFQWYEVLTNKKTGVEYAPWKLVDGEHYAKGAATNKLDIGVPVDGCAYKYEYYCVATTVVNGKTVTAVSARAELRTVHNYSAELECLDTPRLVAIEYRDQYENPSGKKYYRQGSEYHNHECLGTQCYRTKLPAGTKHTFAFKEYLGYGFYTERPSVYKYFYLMECAECGYVELRDSDSEQTVPYTITLDAPDGAYAAYEATDQVTTNALPGTRLYADAPYVNDKGHVFKKWEVADASVDVEVVNDDVNIGTCTFVMPAHHLTLRAVYDETKVPVKSIHIKPGSVPVVSRVITVEVGTTFTVDSELTPSTGRAASAATGLRSGIMSRVG